MEYVSLGGIPLTNFTVNWGPSSSSSSSTPPSTPTDPTSALIAAVRAAASSDPAVDLSKLTEGIEKIEKDRKANIVKALQGVADAEVMKNEGGRRFVVVYWKDNDVQIAKGIEYPVELDDDDEPVGYSVFLDDIDHPFASRYQTMTGLREYFDNRKLPYVISYYDKDK